MAGSPKGKKRNFTRRKKLSAFMLKSRNFWLNVVLALCSMALLLWLTFRFFHWYTNHGKTVEVPDLVGMTETEAMKTLEALSLEGMVSDTIFEAPDSLNFVKSGQVLDQNPRKGYEVKIGRKVRLFLRSLGPPMAAVPNLVNFSHNVARAELEGKGFKVQRVVTPSGSAPKLDLNPPVIELRYQGVVLKSGSRIPKGSRIVLVVDELFDQIEAEDSLNNFENPTE